MDSFEKRCKFFYRQAAEKYSEYPGAELIQMSYRLLWLGEWLRLTHIHIARLLSLDPASIIAKIPAKYKALG
ncbi:hypothetical protein [Pectobacterium versatile]|uniref:hypothetical protein n=1 Tax=Pectobacterium versatile TaxID=2488639 RepID=UPI000D227B99|nr:hypothetical protein [Pectobacterium versatile]AVT57612.1 regulatory protein [Pectobacterium versatile]